MKKITTNLLKNNFFFCITFHCYKGCRFKCHRGFVCRYSDFYTYSGETIMNCDKSISFDACRDGTKNNNKKNQKIKNGKSINFKIFFFFF